jgi:hypothetical protein
MGTPNSLQQMVLLYMTIEFLSNEHETSVRPDEFGGENKME